MFRTINISKLLGQGLIGEDFGDLLEADDEDEDVQKSRRVERIEISCPTFLRPMMRSILSVGKTIKIVRYLENNNLLYTSKKVAGQQSTLDYRAVDFVALCEANVRV